LTKTLPALVDNTGIGIYGHRLSATGPGAWLLLTHPQAGRSSGRPATMSRKKISTTIYITPEQNDRLKLLHERTKVPIAVYIREGIDMVLKHYEHVLPGQMSLEAAGQKKSS
jgi:predicted DNA-binding protein